MMGGSIRLWLVLLGVVVAAGSWVVAQQGTPPPAPDAGKSATPAPVPPPPPPVTPPSTPATEPGTGPAPAPAPGPAPTPPPKRDVPPPPQANAVAATVNGQTISELAVYRALIRDEREDRARVRREILNFLIDNVLVDQYLVALKINVDKKEVEDRVEQLKKEAAEEKQDLKDIFRGLGLTEEEFREQLTCQLRWEKFVTQQATDKALKDFFDKNRLMFDGSQVRARHILIAVADGADAQAKTKAAGIKKQVEDAVAQELAKLPMGTDNLTREKKRIETLEKTFAKAAADHSICPSKDRGGDIDWFPRAGAMVEPFAKAAFALKPHQMSEPVLTEFGCHLILTVDSRPGKDVKFDEMKPFVHQIYEERMREAVLAQVKPSAKISINPPSK
jgi:parvulin-like peptidyl-prolyl isomerase